mgnify:CR=1 FL=1
MKKIMISVAPVAATDILINPRAIARDVYECYKNGASMVHLHCRDLNGNLTPDLSLLEETVAYIREMCDIVVEISTGGVSNLTIEERVQPCYPSWVEANSLNVGSVNLGTSVYQNPIKDVEYCVKTIMDNKKIPETEVFELGMINTVRELNDKFHFVKPILFALVFGHGGEMPATVPALRHMIQALEENFPNGDYLYITTALKVISVTPDGKLSGQLRKVRDESDKSMTIFDADGTEVALYYGGSPYVIADEATGSIYPSKTMLNKSYILGTDALGRDVLTRLMYGTRISMLVALMAAFVNLIIGILYGGISGYLGGTVDMIMMRIVDIISTIPLTLYVILIMQVLGAGIQSIIVALGSVYWVDMARVVRGQILSLKQQEFVLAAKTIGSSATTILFDHLIPNALGSILVTITMLIPSAIFMEAFLGYLGIGLQPPLASLGTMCNDASANLRTSPHELLIPALMICVIMFAFNFVGDGLRDAIDPKSNER